MELTILMPCLNEADTLEVCISKAFRGLEDAHCVGEVLVAGNWCRVEENAEKWKLMGNWNQKMLAAIAESLRFQI